jgi:hypothetical protein
MASQSVASRADVLEQGAAVVATSWLVQRAFASAAVAVLAVSAVALVVGD